MCQELMFEDVFLPTILQLDPTEFDSVQEFESKSTGIDGSEYTRNGPNRGPSMFAGLMLLKKYLKQRLYLMQGSKVDV